MVDYEYHSKFHFVNGPHERSSHYRMLCLLLLYLLTFVESHAGTSHYGSNGEYHTTCSRNRHLYTCTRLEGAAVIGKAPKLKGTRCILYLLPTCGRLGRTAGHRHFYTLIKQMTVVAGDLRMNYCLLLQSGGLASEDATCLKRRNCITEKA
jgi:hypothetical protein